jgi:hypothetical protein
MDPFLWRKRIDDIDNLDSLREVGIVDFEAEVIRKSE